MERSTDLKFLEYFYGMADFGPADEDIRIIIQDNFEKCTGELVPAEYRIRDHG